MSNLNPTNPINPLSVGDMVSAGVRLYRSHLKQYLRLSVIAYLWILGPIVLIAVVLGVAIALATQAGGRAAIPIIALFGGIALIAAIVYGVAKFSEISARIVRLAFGELINQPETLAQVREHTQPRLWRFFLSGLLVGLIVFGLYVAIAIGFFILAAIFGVLAATVPAVGVLVILIGIVAFVVALFVLLRVYSRLLIVEAPIAIEPDVDAVTAISRSWNLTKGSVGRIQWIAVVAFLITLVVQIPSQIVTSILPTGETVEPSVGAISGLIILVVSLLSSALITPFWQVIKAVIYYDLRSRKEGLGLQLRDSQDNQW